MNRTLRLGLLASISMAIAAPSVSATSEVLLEGVYLSEGIRPDGGQYRGLVHVAKHEESVVLTWLLRHPDNEELLVPVAVGMGMVNGGVLAVSSYGPEVDAVAAYRIEEQGRRLTGRYAVVGGDGRAYPEVLTRLPGKLPGAPSDEPMEDTSTERPRTRHTASSFTLR